MAKRRKKKIVRPIYLSAGALPVRLAERFNGWRLVFTDASELRQGGLAAVLFGDPDSEPVIATRSEPAIGSNELEFRATLFGLELARQHFPGQTVALFSDNQDAIIRLVRAQDQGLAQDAELGALLLANGAIDTLDKASINWIKGHSTCRGNALADQHARMAAQ